jgi:hypothetical protein
MRRSIITGIRRYKVLQPRSDHIMHSDRKLFIVLGCLGPRSWLWRCRSMLRAAQASWHWGDDPTGRNGDLEVLWRSGNHLRWQVRNSDAFCFVVVAGWNNLWDIVSIGKEGIFKWLTSMISFRGKDKNGMSVELQAIRYPYRTLKTLS